MEILTRYWRGGDGEVLRYRFANVVLCVGLGLIGALTLAPAALAQTTTFGASLSEAPDVTFGCNAFPIGNGGTQTPLGNDSSCTWSTPTNPTSPTEGMLTPAGAGTITAVRLRVGPTTGPMAVVVLQVEEAAESGMVSCCEASYVGETFTPAANSVTTIPTDLPVRTDGSGEESSPGLEVGDILALSILSDEVPIPAINETGSGLAPNELPSDNVEFPAFLQGQTADDSGTVGYQLDMNADWTSGTPAPAPAPTPAPAPKLSIGTGTPIIKGGDIHLKLGCATAAACSGSVAIESQPPTTAAAVSRTQRRSAVIYAKGSFQLSAGADQSIAAPLTSEGRAAERGHKRVKVYIVATYGAGSSTISHALKLRF